MIENIVQLGDIILKNTDFLDAMIKTVDPFTRKGEKKFVCKFMFNSHTQELTFDLNEEISTDTAKKYMFVGTIGGPNSPQWCTTVKTPDYFLTETIPTLLRQELPEEIMRKIESVMDTMYIHMEGTDGKYKYFLNTEKTGMGKDLDEIFSELKNSNPNEVKTNKQVQKEARTKVGNLFNNFIKERYSCKKDLIGLCVLYIDDVCISCTDFYKKLLKKELQSSGGGSKKPDRKKNSQKMERDYYCSLCRSMDNINFKLTKVKIKYYITDKISFASDINKKNFYRSFGLCKSCYKKLQSGEVYVKDFLKTNISIFDVYIIPHFIFQSHLDKTQLDDCSEKIRKKIKRLNNFTEIMSFRDELYNANIDDDPYLIDFVFFEASNQATKIKKVIKDLEPSVFDEMQKGLSDVNKQYQGYYGKFGFDLQCFFHLIPSIKGKGGKYSARLKQLIEWYSAIFSGRSINEKSIVENSIARARQFIVKNEEFEMINTIIKTNMAISFLMIIGCVKKNTEKGGDFMTIELKPEIRNFIERAGYDDEKTGLFLLGTLISEIAYAQYKRNEKKPILNKLNYWGMDRTKIISLSNEIFNKLKQEKILPYNERLYGECMKLIGQSSLTMPKKEMLFLILTGYSISTTCNIKEAQENKKAANLKKLEGSIYNG